MTTLILSDLIRDQACIGQLALAKYKADTAREICAANAPRLTVRLALVSGLLSHLDLLTPEDTTEC